MTAECYKMDLGRMGEELAGKILEKKGYKIIKKNYRCIYGEIDIVAVKNNVLSFVEVKTRLGDEYGLGRETVGKRKQRKIRNCANLFLSDCTEWYDDKETYDAIEFQVVDIFVEHIEKLAF